MTGSTPEVRAYRWVICACAFLILFVSNGMTLGGMSVFDLELLSALSESTGREVLLGELKVRDGLMFITAGILGMAAGWLADKVGVKPLIIVVSPKSMARLWGCVGCPFAQDVCQNVLGFPSKAFCAL